MVELLSLNSFGFDLRRVSNPQLETQFSPVAARTSVNIRWLPSLPAHGFLTPSGLEMYVSIPRLSPWAGTMRTFRLRDLTIQTNQDFQRAIAE